ncbi:alpha/beta fold hydrolase [Catalinimonas alkaloidigena]|nr:alpha/beta hydrolase [Catalinimonas alkaloidigena]
MQQTAVDQTGLLEVKGAMLPYAVRGRGSVVLFLHGALTDHTMWDRQRTLLADRYRTLAYTQRYFGGGSWRADWPPFGVTTHADDLVAFVQAFGAGPVHLVAWSYAGHVAFQAALHHPALFKSLFVYEPGVLSYVEDPSERDAFAHDAHTMFGPIFEAVQGRGDLEAGVRLLLDGSGQRPGYFATQPADVRALQLRHARTLPLQLGQAEPPHITCADLASLPMPVCVAYGMRTRPVFSVVSRAAVRCLPQGQHRVIPDATHMWPDEAPAAFSMAVASFLATLEPLSADKEAG